MLNDTSPTGASLVPPLDLSTFLRTIPELVWTAQPDGRIEYVNAWGCRLLQASFEQLRDDGWRQFVHPEDLERTLALRQYAFETGDPYEAEYRLRDGQAGIYRWFLARALPVCDTSGQITHWLGISTDIEKQKWREEALCQSQERVRALVDSNIIGIIVAEGEEIVEANDTFLRMTGYSRDDLLQRRINWVHITAPEDLDRTRQAHQELAHYQSMQPYEKEYVCKDGSHLPVLVGGVVFPYDPSQSIYFVLDNSARKELEQRKENFLSMASHELKTPLTAVKMRIQLAKTRLMKQGYHEAAAVLAKAEGSVKLLERLIKELLDGSRIQAGKLEYVQEPVDLEALLSEVADTMQQVSATHPIVVRGTIPCTLIGDKGRLEQVFINLISNAITYSPSATTIEIDCHVSSEAVTVSVRDHGIGIPQELHDKIFERFYRISDLSQRAVPGLGMGLYIVAEIVRHHGGTIQVESEAGNGSTFHVTLPLKRLRTVLPRG